MTAMTSTQTSTLAAALDAAERGWPVFPIRPNDKRPAFPDHTADRCIGRDLRCRAGHQGWEPRATTDPDRIRRAWSMAPYNIGIATGRAGLVVVDLDQPKPGNDSPPAAWRLPGVANGADVLAVLARAGRRIPGWAAGHVYGHHRPERAAPVFHGTERRAAAQHRKQNWLAHRHPCPRRLCGCRRFHSCRQAVPAHPRSRPGAASTVVPPAAFAFSGTDTAAGSNAGRRRSPVRVRRKKCCAMRRTTSGPRGSVGAARRSMWPR